MARYFYLSPMLGGPGAPRYPLTKQAQLIGRSERADISLFEPTVSRQHATIEIAGAEILLKDLGSKHGTFVNSRRVNQASLKVGDIVVIGLSLVLRLEATDKPVPRPESLGLSPDVTRELQDPSTTAVRMMNTQRTTRRRARPTLSPIKQRKRNLVQQAKVYKLAGVGAHCMAALPALQQQIEALSAQIRELDPSVAQGVSASAARLEALIQQMTDGATLLPANHLETIPLAEIVRQAVSQVSAEYSAQRVDFISDISDELSVRVDVQQMIEALVEILRNACQFSQEGSIVEGVATVQKEEVVLTISDQGLGIPQSMVDRLFDPFVTCSSDLDAIGLGLFEARQIILSMGGSLSVSSKQTFGTTVRLVLPLATL